MIDIRALRRRYSLTQAELGNLLGVHICTIGRWERGLQHPHPACAARLFAIEQGNDRPIESRQGAPPRRTHAPQREECFAVSKPIAASETLDRIAASETLDRIAASETLDRIAASETLDPSETLAPIGTSETHNPRAVSETLEQIAASETHNPRAASETLDPSETLAPIGTSETHNPRAVSETLEQIAASETLDRIAASETLDPLAPSPRNPSPRRQQRTRRQRTVRAPRAARSVPQGTAATVPIEPLAPFACADRWSLYRADLFDVLPTLADASFDGLIGDLPYSSGGLHIRTRRLPSCIYPGPGFLGQPEDFDGDQRDQLSWERWATEVLRRCHRVLKRSAVVALFIDWRQLAALTLAIQCAGFTLRGIAVWDKTEGARPAPGRFRHQCEFIVWGSKGDLPTDRNVPVLPGLICEPVRAADKHHLTGKPTAVMRWLTQFVIPGGRILDPAAGSGTTGVGALLEGRQFVGIEQDPAHVKRAVARLHAAAQGHVLAAQEAAQKAASKPPKRPPRTNPARPKRAVQVRPRPTLA